MDDAFFDLAWRRYVALTRQRPDCFQNPDPQGIVILTDETEVRAAEKRIARRLEHENRPPEWSRAGLFYEDPWLYVVRDVVRFPNGSDGTYHHIFMKGGPDGVVVLPVVEGRIVLIRHFRNGLRGWSLEIPRGAPETGIASSANAAREIQEEIGGNISRLEYLGPMHNNNGMITETMQCYLAELSATGAHNHAEGIAATTRVTPQELEGLITKGMVTDCHTIVAFTLARMKALLPR